MLKKNFLVFLLLLTSSVVFGQDTVRIMSYNILNYPTASSVSAKNGYLTSIVNHVQPDILGVVELNTDSTYADIILNDVLNIGGGTYSRAYYSSTIGSNLCNMLFFDNTKFGLKRQYQIPFPSLRNMDHYVLYHKSPNLSVTQDTIYLNVIVAHFKSSNTTADAATRNQMATAVMQHLSANVYAPGNVVIMGDFNLYQPTESAYQTLINYTASPQLSFNDVVPSSTTWNNNSAYALHHTQSTRLTNLPDGGATGGMDDRFDFILFSNYLINNTDKVRLVPNSYKAVGQDGLRFNSSLLSPTNNTAPSTVINALYNMSDHLPVITDLVIEWQSLVASITPSPSASFCSGSNVQLTANTGTGYVYQWLLNNNPISGATGTSYLASSAGNYSVVISNGTSSVTSSVVSVTETAVPSPTMTGASLSCELATETYSVPFTLGHTYSWTVSSNGTIMNGQGTNQIVVVWNSGTSGVVTLNEGTP